MTDAAPVADPDFAEPYIDVDEWRSEPIPRRYVHGGFRGTDTRFSMHLPPAERYGGRFFQYIAPVPDSEHFSERGTGEEDKVSFAVESGAIFLETNGGGPAAANPFSGLDPSIGAYRANAASARFARVVAQEMYGDHRVYGYAFGGSGGGFRTIGGAENTVGVWDGFVPYVIGSPMAIPNCFTVRMHALRVLRDRFDDIVDAMDPGGSGNPYAELSEEEAAALREATRMGFPPRSWFAHRTMGMHALAVLYPGVQMMDPGYFEDFWTVPGYLGADGSPSLDRDRVQHETRVASLLGASGLAAAGIANVTHPGTSTGAADDAWRGSGPDGATLAVQLETEPARNPHACELLVESGGAAGARLVVIEVIDDIAVLGPADPSVVSRLRPGDAVTVDNSGFLAMQTYHRHQVPGPEYPVWDQFRDEGGAPLFPQRPMLVGPMFAAGAAGTVQTGRFEGRMIVVECLLDREAYPWQADWYRARVREHLGNAADDHFRLWMVDNALHGDFEEQEHPARTVSYLGVLHQALRDVAAWVEEGVEPPETSVYEVVDGQIVLPDSAEGRRGVQPVVALTVDGGPRADARPGEAVTLQVRAQTPGAGRIVSVEWDLHGTGDFTSSPSVPEGATAFDEIVCSFDAPGTYFPAVRVTAHRDGDSSSPFARIRNLDRVRVSVHAGKD